MSPVLDPFTPRRRRAVVRTVIDWYAVHRRDLPWRAPDASPWAIVVSEFMLQQTPVARVLEPWRRWLDRWPTPAALAAAPAGEAVRAWGRLGYPRRALRLHAAAVAITEEHDGEVPTELEQLRALPGVGEYTAAAVASFAHRQRHVVLDTNVRRVLARLADGVAFPPAHPTRAEYAEAARWLPETGEEAATWAVASMELGATVCTARSPDCDRCPVRQRCRWWSAGRPAHDGPPRTGQSYEGTDRQCRGALLAVLRSSDDPVPAEDVLVVWPDRSQAELALTGLLTDGLAVRRGDQLALPG